MDCMKYNDHKPIDTAAQRIYMQLVKKYGWEIACAGKFAPHKLLYAKYATPEGYSVWFVAHSNLTSTHNSNGKWINTFKQDCLLEEWLPDGMEYHGGELTLDNTLRVVFAKKKDGYYYFMGVYKSVSIEKKANGNPLKTYKRISTEYPFAPCDKSSHEKTDKVRCVWGSDSDFSKEVIAHFILKEHPEYKSCIDDKVTEWFQNFIGSSYEGDVLTTAKYLCWFDSYFQDLGCDKNHILPYVKELFRCFYQIGDSLYNEYLRRIDFNNNSQLISIPYFTDKKQYMLYVNRVFANFIPLNINFEFDYERAIRIIKKYSESFEWINKYEFIPKWQSAFCIVVDFILKCDCSEDEAPRKANYDRIAEDFLKKHLSLAENSFIKSIYISEKKTAIKVEKQEGFKSNEPLSSEAMPLPNEKTISKSVKGHYPKFDEKLSGKLVIINSIDKQIEMGTVVEVKDDMITILMDNGQTRKFNKRIAIKNKSLYIVDGD